MNRIIHAMASLPTSLLLSVLLFTAGFLTSCATAPRGTAGAPIALFNGRDFSGWTAVSATPGTRLDDVWSVREGIIVCRGEPMGYLQTERAFTNFKLHVEWRWAPGKEPGNSGVFLRINGPPRALPRTIECQLKSGDAGDVYGFHGMQLDGDPGRRTAKAGHELAGDLVGVKKRFANEKPPGQWNRLDIELNGGRLTVSVNGRQVNEATDCELLAGPVGLQSEGGEIHFRNVVLTPLP